MAGKNKQASNDGSGCFSSSYATTRVTPTVAPDESVTGASLTDRKDEMFSFSGSRFAKGDSHHLRAGPDKSGLRSARSGSSP
ncbi:MAG: hypothetical protein ABIH04_03015 [Planctomycetota bacterium]